MNSIKTFSIVVATIFLFTCMGYPDKIQPVSNFELEPYLGKWYEIARLDHSFERGMSRVSAEYSLRKDGGVKVMNRGYLDKKGKWKEATGKAYFVDKTDEGYLKVSFFGPFYGSYVVFEMEKNNYAFVSGPNTNYLWLLSRTPQVAESTKESFIQKARDAGFPVEDIIWVVQDQ